MNSNYLAQLTSDPVLLLILQKAGLSVTENILLCLVDIWLEVGGACTMHNMLYLNLACFHLVKNSPRLLSFFPICVAGRQCIFYTAENYWLCTFNHSHTEAASSP